MSKTLAFLPLILLLGFGYSIFKLNDTSKQQLPLSPSEDAPPQISTTKSLTEFLAFTKPSSDIQTAYRFAQENPQEVLSLVKCYCGCLKNGQHKNNRDCFINTDGTFDLMGLNCGLCVKTALTAKQMLADGKTPAEIANYADKRWGKPDL